MVARSLNVNIAGRVKKVRTRDFLVPLYEAISNSIHAIEARGGPGAIRVQLLREPRQGDLSDTTADREPPITGFVITDDGVGFDAPNMESFEESDSTFKATIGGKGVGRFAWLKFFEKATIESVFEENGTRRKRVFIFSTAGVDEQPVVDVKSPISTSVRLEPLDVKFEPKTRKSLHEVAVEIVEHFIAYLVTSAMPSLKIEDGSATEDINELYGKSIGKNVSKQAFSVRGTEFNATSIRFFLGGGANVAFLCGHKRVADRILLGKKNPFFARRLTDENLSHYAFQIFVQGDYLDQLVNDDREGFRFPEPSSQESLGGAAITKDELADAVLEIAKKELSEEIARMAQKNIETVTSFVMQDAPQYRFIVAKHRDEIANIHDSEKARIDMALRRIQFEEEQKTRAQVGVLIRQADEASVAGTDEWTKTSRELLQKLNEEGKASLAAYIVQRKLILELLQKRMDLSDGKHAREAAVHELIFPMRTTSDDISYERQNLWLIDERLSYHYYLASDKALSSIDVAQADSAKEPDIIVFNRPIALHDRLEGERLESVVIIEFKRPGESSVEGQKNPVQQIQEYIELIQAGRAKSRKDRPILATNSTYFFGYVVCELDPLLKKVLRRLNMRETPDGRGVFGFFEEHRAYIEVLSYEKMIDDARKRNRILFEKLQLPIS